MFNDEDTYIINLAKDLHLSYEDLLDPSHGNDYDKLAALAGEVASYAAQLSANLAAKELDKHK